MPYNIKRSNGDLYAVISENTIIGPNSPEGIPAAINLIGRNKVQFGLSQNENFLWLAETFCSNEVPSAPLKGQLWYNTRSEVLNETGGELLLCPNDGESDREKWLSVPVMARVSAEPAEAVPGRMIIFKNDTLKVFINGEWRTIETGSANNNIFNTLLPIRYSDSNKVISVSNPDYSELYNPDAPPSINVKVIPHIANTWTDVAVFNDGGAIQTGAPVVVNGDGALKYGGTYKFKASIVARDANNVNNFKSWVLNGSFSVGSISSQETSINNLAPDSTKFIKPDPRIIKEAFNTNYSDKCSKEIVSQSGSTDLWDVKAEPRLNWPSAGTAENPTAPQDVVNGDYFGLMFQGLVPNNVDLQWSISFNLTAIPQITPGLASSINP